MGAQPGGLSHAVHAAARNLRVDHVTAGVLQAFSRAGVASILLKGPSTVRWLYEGEPRRYRDCDLLISPLRIDDAERVLWSLGFVPEVDRRRMPPWWQEDAIDWLNPDGAVIDLHRTLTGVGVDAARVWELLSADTETMSVGGVSATVLSLPARALHLALHTSQHSEDRGDLERALAQAREEIWQEAARLADDLDATAALAAGLRLLPEGRALAARLGLPSQRTIEVSLRAERAPVQALTLERLARAGVGQRIAIVRYKLIPPPTFMRHWSELARRGRVGLLLAYGQRLAWVGRTAPAALRAWRRARRAVQPEPPQSGA